jgi:hypothetical protein
MNSKSKRLSITLAALLLVVAGAGRSVYVAAARSPTATLNGSVLDERGHVVPGVEITALNLSTAWQRHATTNAKGDFVIPLLPPGHYALTAQRSGFATVEVRGIVLNVGDRHSLSIRLRVGEISETVTVIDGEAAGIKQTTSINTVVNRQFVENLPLNGRSFQTLFELAPGSVLTRASFNEQGQFSVNGQRANANYFTVDGVSANAGVSAGGSPGQSAAGGLPALTVLGGANNLVPLDAVEEFLLMTSSYAPEFGRTSGAQVSIATRSGTSELHGSLFEYLRNDALDANDWFANSRGLPRPAIRQHNFGMTLGGPLARDRAFFFVAYEGMRLGQPRVVLTEVPSAGARAAAPAAVRPLLEAFPIANGADLGNGFAEFAASYTDPSNFDSASARFDFIATDGLALFGRYNYAPSRTIQRGGVSSPILGGQSLNTLNRTSLETRSLTAGATAALSPRVTGDLRVNWSRTKGETVLALDDFGGAVPPPPSLLFPPFARPEDSGFQLVLSGGLNSGFGTGKSVNNLQRQLNIVGHLSFVSRGHELKFGLDYRRLSPIYSPLGYSQSAVFGEGEGSGVLAAIESGTASRVRVTADAGPRLPVFTNLSAYAQDTARLTPRLTLVYGLRWEFNPPPAEKNGNHPAVLVWPSVEVSQQDSLIGGGGSGGLNFTLAPLGTRLWRADYYNFAPRVGAAYLLGPGTVVRGGLGIFYDLGNGQAAQVFGGVFPFMKEKFLLNVGFPLGPASAQPPPLDLDPPYGPVHAFEPGLKLPLTLQWSAVFEQSLGAHQTLAVSYVGARGRQLLLQAALPNSGPDFTLIRLTVNGSSSDYHAFQAQFKRRLAHGLQAQSSYTWSHSIDDDSDDSSNLFFTNSFAPLSQRGPSNFDVRHSFNAAMTYSLPRLRAGAFVNAAFRGWSIDAIFRARTATPVNVLQVLGTLPGELAEVRRPDLVEGVALYLEDPSAPGGRRINPEAFRLVAVGQGKLGRNALRGFGLSQLDMAVRRQFALTERVRLQLRAEFFNVLNHPNFDDPVSDLGSRFFGQSTQMFARGLGTGGLNGGLTPLHQVGGPRSIQLALRLGF